MSVELYGLDSRGLEQANQATIELMLAFRKELFSAKGWLGSYQHFRNATDLLLNVPSQRIALARGVDYDVRKHDTFIWNEWTEEMVEGFCEAHWATTVTGPNASFKSGTAGWFGLGKWYARPTETIIVITSTSLPGLRKRIWKEILKHHRRANPGFGYVAASDFAIRFQKGSDESGIFGVATGQDEGEIQKAVDKIIGFHAKHVVAIVDEMQATNEAIVKACSSLEAGADTFQFIGLGNADSELDAHGRMSEPKEGWDSISPETGRWDTNRGICIHLDGLDSPRVKEGDEFYPGLLRQQDIDNEAKAYGEDSPEFWRTRRGFWAPQGTTKTIFSPAMIAKFRAKEKASWVSGFKMGAGLDPAFEGGDRCILRFGKCGEFSGAPYEEKGLVGVELGDVVPIKVSATSKQPIHFQIVELVRHECEQRGVGPEMLGIDSSGEGGGLASIFQREWSPAITLVEFGGRASELPVSEHNPKRSREEYINRVTELWYQSRVMLQNGQIRGLDNATAIEFCQRLYDNRGNMKIVESKTEMKKRTKRSPDLADAVVVLLELFRQKESLTLAGGTTPSADESWTKFVRKNDTYDPNSYLMEA